MFFFVCYFLNSPPIKIPLNIWNVFVQVGFTSAPGEGGIVGSKDFDRKFSPHVVSTHSNASFAVIINTMLQLRYPIHKNCILDNFGSLFKKKSILDNHKEIELILFCTEWNFIKLIWKSYFSLSIYVIYLTLCYICIYICIHEIYILNISLHMIITVKFILLVLLIL